MLSRTGIVFAGQAGDFDRAFYAASTGARTAHSVRISSRQPHSGSEDVQETQAQTTGNDQLLTLVHLQAPEEGPGEDGEEEIGKDAENCSDRLEGRDQPRFEASNTYCTR